MTYHPKWMLKNIYDTNDDGKVDNADKVDGKDASELKFTAIFGDGSDGDVTISADTTLSRDMYYNNLTIDSGVTLNPNGYIICVKDTLTINGTIARNGNNGGCPSGGAALATNTIGGSGAGGNGGALSSSGCSGQNGYYGGAGGKGQDETYHAGGAGGSSPMCSIGNPVILLPTNVGGAGGGGGGGGTSRQGAGGGSGGGVICIYAKNIVFNGTIEAKGGNGGIPNGCGHAGGGGGGGYILLIYSSKTGSGSYDVSGGAAGGGDAEAGSAGQITEIEL